MRYTFKCEKCEVEDIIEKPIAEGPPEQIECLLCGGTMFHQFGTNFILKGDDWPGKTIKQASDRGVEAFEEAQRIRKNEKEVSNEVLAERRKGRQSFREFRKRYPNKVKQYTDGVNRGVKGS